MDTAAFSIRPERPNDLPAIDALHGRAFGPGRYARAAYRLREGIPHEAALSFVAEAGGRLVGSVRLTRITIGERPALLLGPLAVDPDLTGRGCGKALVRRAVEAATEADHRLILLVGDEPYYGPLGFARVPPGAITLPGPVDPARILVAALVPGSADGLAGPTRRPR